MLDIVESTLLVSSSTVCKHVSDALMLTVGLSGYIILAVKVFSFIYSKVSF